MSDHSLYNDYVEFHAMKVMEGHDPLVIAALLVVQALSMYKTMLDEDGYNSMVDKISESRNQVLPLVTPAGATLQ